MVDALTALAVLGATMGLALGAVRISAQIAASATEEQMALAPLEGLNAKALDKIGVYGGEEIAGRWRVELMTIRPQTTAAGFAVCRRETELVGKSGRSYRLRTMQPCPALEAS